MNETQSLSAWQAFLHPRRACALVSSLREDVASARSEADGCREQAVKLKSEVASLKEERSRLTAVNTELSLRLKKKEEEYAGLEGDIAEVQVMFEKVEKMKAGYDRRIARFEQKVTDLQTALEREQNRMREHEREEEQADITPIPRSVRTARPAAREPRQLSLPDEQAPDWYSPLDL